MNQQYDVIVIGGGHNGLTCAAFLARGGRSVLVVEAADELGGAARNAEIAPGYTVSACAHILHLLHPRVRSALKLERHGLKLATRQMPTVALGEAGNHLTIKGDKIDGELVDTEDSRSWQLLHKRLLRMSRVLHSVFGRIQPRLGTKSWADRFALARLGLSLRLLGKRDMREFMRIVNMNAADLLNDELSDERLKGALAFDSVLGANFGPRSPGSVLSWMYRLTGEANGSDDGLSIPVGGMGAVAGALAASARDLGVDIQTAARVRRVVVEDDRAVAVELESGSVLRASAVVSSADPKTTLRKLVEPEYLDTDFLRSVNNFRSNGLVAKLNLALNGLPEFTGLDNAALGGRLVIAHDIGYVERAFDHSKYGEYSSQPAIEITIPTLHDSSLAPEGGHILSAVVQYAPYDLDGGWDAQREAFADHVVAIIARYAPGLAERIVARQLLTPVDIEREFGISGGHWHHGDIAFDQMLMLRPVPGWAQYQMPLPGLYLCGAGSHPGGGVMGAAGMNAAQRVLTDLKREK